MSLRSQLIGTWKSDRKRTLDGLAAYHKQKNSHKRRFMSGMFGRLELKYTRKYIHFRFDDEDSVRKERYEIIDETDDTLVVKVQDTFPEPFDAFDGPSYLVIQFDETRYHEYMSAYTSRFNYTEWFRKVKTD